MGKTYKRNDRHFTKGDRNFVKPKKQNKTQFPPKKWKQGDVADIYESTQL